MYLTTVVFHKFFYQLSFQVSLIFFLITASVFSFFFYWMAIFHIIVYFFFFLPPSAFVLRGGGIHSSSCPLLCMSCGGPIISSSCPLPWLSCGGPIFSMSGSSSSPCLSCCGLLHHHQLRLHSAYRFPFCLLYSKY